MEMFKIWIMLLNFEEIWVSFNPKDSKEEVSTSKLGLSHEAKMRFIRRESKVEISTKNLSGSFSTLFLFWSNLNPRFGMERIISFQNWQTNRQLFNWGDTCLNLMVKI